MVWRDRTVGEKGVGSKQGMEVQPKVETSQLVSRLKTTLFNNDDIQHRSVNLGEGKTNEYIYEGKLTPNRYIVLKKNRNSKRPIEGIKAVGKELEAVFDRFYTESELMKEKFPLTQVALLDKRGSRALIEVFNKGKNTWDLESNLKDELTEDIPVEVLKEEHLGEIKENYLETRMKGDEEENFKLSKIRFSQYLGDFEDEVLNSYLREKEDLLVEPLMDLRREFAEKFIRRSKGNEYLRKIDKEKLRRVSNRVLKGTKEDLKSGGLEGVLEVPVMLLPEVLRVDHPKHMPKEFLEEYTNKKTKERVERAAHKKVWEEVKGFTDTSLQEISNFPNDIPREDKKTYLESVPEESIKERIRKKTSSLKRKYLQETPEKFLGEVSKETLKKYTKEAIKGFAWDLREELAEEVISENTALRGKVLKKEVKEDLESPNFNQLKWELPGNLTLEEITKENEGISKYDRELLRLVEEYYPEKTDFIASAKGSIDNR